MAVELRHELDLDRVLFVPAGDPPHKPDLPVSAAHHRLRMLELALDGRPEFAFNLVDIGRVGPSYTKDMLATLKERLASSELIFLMGSDSLRDLQNWNDPTRILELAEIGVATRPDVEVDLEEVYQSLPAARGRVAIVEIPLIGVSSSDLRRRVAVGEPITFQVPSAVERYIHDNQLYPTTSIQGRDTACQSSGA